MAQHAPPALCPFSPVLQAARDLSLLGPPTEDGERKRARIEAMLGPKLKSTVQVRRACSCFSTGAARSCMGARRYQQACCVQLSVFAPPVCSRTPSACRCTLCPMQTIQRADSLGMLAGGERPGSGASAAAAQRSMASAQASAAPAGPATPAAVASIYRQRPRRRGWADLAGGRGGEAQGNGVALGQLQGARCGSCHLQARMRRVPACMGCQAPEQSFLRSADHPSPLRAIRIPLLLAPQMRSLPWSACRSGQRCWKLRQRQRAPTLWPLWPRF